jgi:cytidylate kinase
MKQEIEIINSHYNDGLAFKDIARKDDKHIEDFQNAAKSFLKAAHLVDALLKGIEDKINFITRSNASKNYYLYEANECLYSYAYKSGDFEEAIKFARKAEKHINDAINIIDLNQNKLNDETKAFLIKQKSNWKLCQLTVPLRKLEPIGQNAMIAQDYVTALDSYKQMERIQDKAQQYVENSDLPEVFKRTEKGNYYASKASLAMTLAGIYIKKSNKSDYKIDILKQFLTALTNIEKAQENNPEQDRYKEGSIKIRRNIESILRKNKNDWFDYFTELSKDQNLIKIMKKTDAKLYKMQRAKLEIEKNKPKQILLTFGLYFSFFLILLYALFQIAISEIHWFRFLALILALPVFFTVIGAFALRSTDSLKEENFIELMKLAFQTNISGLKILTNKNKEAEDEQEVEHEEE